MSCYGCVGSNFASDSEISKFAHWHDRTKVHIVYQTILLLSFYINFLIWGNINALFGSIPLHTTKKLEVAKCKFCVDKHNFQAAIDSVNLTMGKKQKIPFEGVIIY